jgi:hypothetical protein
MVFRGPTVGILIKHSCLLYPQKDLKIYGISEGHPVVVILFLPSLPLLRRLSLGSYGNTWI